MLGILLISVFKESINTILLIRSTKQISFEYSCDKSISGLEVKIKSNESWEYLTDGYFVSIGSSLGILPFDNNLAFTRDETLKKWLDGLAFEQLKDYSSAQEDLMIKKIGEHILATSHYYYWKKDYACFIFLSEFGKVMLQNTPEQNSLALSLVNDPDGKLMVASAYERLLLYFPSQPVFQLMYQLATRK